MAFKGPQNLADVTTTHWKGVIYGGPGVGKTVFCASSANMRTFVFDVDNGLNSANAYLTRHGMDKSRVKFHQVVTPADFYEAFDWLKIHIADFDLVVVDTATELQRILLRSVMDSNKHTLADQRDWGAILTMMENITFHFRNLPAHVIFCAHEMAKADDTDGGSPQQLRPSFQGAYKVEYAKHFGFIGRYVLSNQKNKDTGELKLVRALRFGADPLCHSKDRSGNLNGWEVPDLDAIFDKFAASTVKLDGE